MSSISECRSLPFTAEAERSLAEAEAVPGKKMAKVAKAIITIAYVAILAASVGAFFVVPGSALSLGLMIGGMSALGAVLGGATLLTAAKFHREAANQCSMNAEFLEHVRSDGFSMPEISSREQLERLSRLFMDQKEKEEKFLEAKARYVECLRPSFS